MHTVQNVIIFTIHIKLDIQYSSSYEPISGTAQPHPHVKFGMAAATLDSPLLMTMISNSGMDQSRCHWIMRLCGETADSGLCAFLGIDSYQSVL